ncbi:tetratricopeptide repeat protein [Magnetospirillum sp. SS-4]|uniref:tetratricopeptide repeat protein n=1 Tax=Magnetospirillum sp. SS-4 TaxID=2681465 RepID=UPI001383F81A|nr:tetratricopeptide repeat protein [Magnetospirillum sp. SS-4]CAA7615486.1 hypothetical protein MTBSS4_130026 [Magnetospirillum sp. SS-4]
MSESVPLADALTQAIAHHQAGRLAEAEVLYRAALDAVQNQPQAHHNLGIVLAVTGRAEAALPHFKAALEADASQGQFWLSHAELLLHMGQAGTALEVLDEGRRHGLSGDVVDAVTARACMAAALEHHGAGRLTEAASGYRRVLDLAPADVAAQANLGIALTTLGRFKEAEGHARRAVEIDSGNVAAQFNLGCLLYDTSRMDEAEACFRRVLDLEPGHVDALTNLARVRQDQGRIDEPVFVAPSLCRRRA